MIVPLSRGEKTFRVLNAVGLTLLAFATVYPFAYAAVLSLNGLGRSGLWFLPNVRNLSLGNYRGIFRGEVFRQAFLVSIYRVSVGVPLMLLVTGSAAFALTKRNLKLRVPIVIFFLVTMFFSGGLIPYYMVVRSLRLLNTFWILVLPGVCSAWTMVILKTSFQSQPAELAESARMDGAGHVRIFSQIALPLAKPVLAVVALFHAVDLWNEWFTGAFFINVRRLKPLQTLLQNILRGETLGPGASAYLMVSLAPVICLYVFLQRYFAKGVFAGAIR